MAMKVVVLAGSPRKDGNTDFISILEEEISAYPNVIGSYAIVKVGDKYLVG